MGRVVVVDSRPILGGRLVVVGEGDGTGGSGGHGEGRCCCNNF